MLETSRSTIFVNDIEVYETYEFFGSCETSTSTIYDADIVMNKSFINVNYKTIWSFTDEGPQLERKQNRERRSRFLIPMHPQDSSSGSSELPP